MINYWIKPEDLEKVFETVEQGKEDYTRGVVVS